MEELNYLVSVMIDCTDNEKMCSFYTELLGWKKVGPYYGCTAVRNSKGLVLLFRQEDDYVPPVWPEEDGKQQKQMHFDFVVPDLDAAVKRAEELGALKAEKQYGNGTNYVTMLDPVGHPFCLCHGDE
ncbi:MAG: VOC family protein [Candidatus Omnitrophica bacterium]|nr:VOC family protein [Candidatus Omnitrophota bacterium]